MAMERGQLELSTDASDAKIRAILVELQASKDYKSSKPVSIQLFSFHALTPATGVTNGRPRHLNLPSNHAEAISLGGQSSRQEPGPAAKWKDK